MTQLLALTDAPAGSQVTVPFTDRGTNAYAVLVPGGGVTAPIAETVIVAKNGNDATADGSLARPFLTIQAAISSITDASSTKPYAVLVFPGIYTETFAVAPWTYVTGVSRDAVFLNPVTANWISAGFATGTQDGGICNVTLLTSVAVNFATVGSTGAGTFKMTDVILGSAVNLTFTGNNVANVVNLADLMSIGPTSSALTCTNITTNMGSVNLRNGALTFNGTDAYATQHRIQSMASGGTLTVAWTGADSSKGLFVTFYQPGPPLAFTAFSVTGAGATCLAHTWTQVTGANAAQTFSFGVAPNGGTVLVQGAENTIAFAAGADRTYTLEAPGSIGTKVKLINLSPNFTVSVAFGGTATADGGIPTYAPPFNTLQFYGSSTVNWTAVQNPQRGSAQLTNGVSAFIPADINAYSTITVTLRTFNTQTGLPAALGADRVNGTRAGGGGFIIRSLTAAGAAVATDQSTYDWHVIGLGSGT
jgi:hypothetical protein